MGVVSPMRSSCNGAAAAAAAAAVVVSVAVTVAVAAASAAAMREAASQPQRSPCMAHHLAGSAGTPGFWQQLQANRSP